MLMAAMRLNIPTAVSYTHLDVYKRQGYRFEYNTEVDILSVAESSLNTSGVVGMCFNPSVVIVENIVLFGTCLLYTSRCV